MRMKLNRNEDNPIKGHPLTNQRRLLLKLLRETESHIDAKELFRLAYASDESISQATVYRTLKLFKELGLIEEMRLDKVRCLYEIKQSSEHQHLICKACGKIIEFKSPYFQKLIEAVQRDLGCKIDKAQLYLEGCCPDCKENKTDL
jgi:Fur family transcriptional regulator, ferric uptake regulator